MRIHVDYEETLVPPMRIHVDYEETLPPMRIHVDYEEVVFSDYEEDVSTTLKNVL